MGIVDAIGLQFVALDADRAHVHGRRCEVHHGEER